MQVSRKYLIGFYDRTMKETGPNFVKIISSDLVRIDDSKFKIRTLINTRIFSVIYIGNYVQWAETYYKMLKKCIPQLLVGMRYVRFCIG